ncbi:MAG: hypothetical protein RBR86_03850 [Pseudobdellovibrionaceae bacterium]|jgi:hypothetical protein|nr:hypothetical protein [Pseudobdellovibrionaceae bacterium]
MLQTLSYIEKVLALVSLPSVYDGLTHAGGCDLSNFKDKLILGVSISLLSLAYILILSGLTVFLMQSQPLFVVLTTIGGVLLLSVATLFISIRLFKRYKSYRIEKGVKDFLNDASGIFESVGVKTDELFQDNVGKAIIATVIAGFLAGKKISY